MIITFWQMMSTSVFTTSMCRASTSSKELMLLTTSHASTKSHTWIFLSFGSSIITLPFFCSLNGTLVLYCKCIPGSFVQSLFSQNIEQATSKISEEDDVGYSLFSQPSKSCQSARIASRSLCKSVRLVYVIPLKQNGSQRDIKNLIVGC